MPTAFSDVLREWRGARRMSQLELAVKAHTTQRHVSFLESGRSAPGRDMALRLADALDLSLRDRNRMLAMAGFAPQFAESSLDGPAMPAVRQALNAMLTAQLPNPAVVTRLPGVAVAANRAMRLLTIDVAPALLQPPANIYRLALHPDGLAKRVVNFDEWSAHVVRAVERRAERTRHPDLSALADELRAYLPPRACNGYLSGTISPLLLQTDAGTISLITTNTSFSNATDVTLDELDVEAFLPSDERTAGVLRTLDRNTAHEPPWPLLGSTLTLPSQEHRRSTTSSSIEQRSSAP